MSRKSQIGGQTRSMKEKPSVFQRLGEQKQSRIKDIDKVYTDISASESEDERKFKASVSATKRKRKHSDSSNCEKRRKRPEDIHKLSARATEQFRDQHKRKPLRSSRSEVKVASSSSSDVAARETTKSSVRKEATKKVRAEKTTQSDSVVRDKPIPERRRRRTQFEFEQKSSDSEVKRNQQASQSLKDKRSFDGSVDEVADESKFSRQPSEKEMEGKGIKRESRVDTDNELSQKQISRKEKWKKAKEQLQKSSEIDVTNLIKEERLQASREQRRFEEDDISDQSSFEHSFSRSRSRDHRDYRSRSHSFERFSDERSRIYLEDDFFESDRKFGHHRGYIDDHLYDDKPDKMLRQRRLPRHDSGPLRNRYEDIRRYDDDMYRPISRYDDERRIRHSDRFDNHHDRLIGLGLPSDRSESNIRAAYTDRHSDSRQTRDSRRDDRERSRNRRLSRENRVKSSGSLNSDERRRRRDDKKRHESENAESFMDSDNENSESRAKKSALNDVDWTLLKEDRELQLKTPLKPTAPPLHERYSKAAIYSRIGISGQYADNETVEEIKELCKERNLPYEHLGTNPAAIGVHYQKQQKDRNELVQSISGTHQPALSSRTDMFLREKLRKSFKIGKRAELVRTPHTELFNKMCQILLKA